MSLAKSVAMPVAMSVAMSVARQALNLPDWPHMMCRIILYTETALMKIATPSMVLLLCLSLAASQLAAQTANPESDSPELPELQQPPADSTQIKSAPPPVEIKRMPRLKVTITGLEPSSGTVEVSLFNSEETFMVKPLLQESGEPDENGHLEIRFLNVFEGEYGLVVVHDENANGLFDSGFLGFGAEPVAYSNKARPWLGRPTFEDVKFDVQENVDITISMD